jgi:GGDEF domain-containing protein
MAVSPEFPIVLGRLRQGLWLAIGMSIGYVIGTGPFSEWVHDLLHMLDILWLAERASRGSSGILPLLVAGYLIGQGLFLLGRRIVDVFSRRRTRTVDDLAAWDPALRVASRFGLERYLRHCGTWAEQEPANRTQSLALFRVQGLGRVNESEGTLAVTRLLQTIAAELRDASLPDAASRLSYWFVRYAPRPIVASGKGVPFPRLAARWSGSTFALAFRELDAHRVIAIAQELANWIRSELSTIGSPETPTLRAGLVLGPPHATVEGLLSVASQSLADATESRLTVIHGPADARATHDSPIRDVEYREYPIHLNQPTGAALAPTPTLRTRAMAWFRSWGPATSCLAAAVLLLQLTGSSAPVQPNSFPWPAQLTELQLVEPSGSKTIRLLRQTLPAQSAGGWTLSDVSMVQGNPEDGRLDVCQFHVRVTNDSSRTYYLSAHDFAAIDSKRRLLPFEPRQMVKFSQGLAGRWMGPGETFDGWLRISPRGDRCLGLQFQPDRFTRITVLGG